ncbi:MAG TPA: histidine kinase [Anaerolineales bacterium]|nr:histidine kinase [Anaerolineales bacterium]
MTENGADPSVLPLRERAEEKFKADRPRSPAQLSPEETQQILHELQVHQIELEMQNEELLRTQVELEASRERYFDLYDLAPVGYVTLNPQGLILEANFTAATLFNMERSGLVMQPLTRFLHSEDQAIYYRLFKQLFATSTRQVCELRLRRSNDPPRWVLLEMIFSRGSDGKPVCRAMISDITSRRLAEQLLHERVETHAYEQNIMLEISQTLASTLEFQPNLVLDQLQEIIDFTHGGLFVLEDQTLVTLAIRGTPELEQSLPIRIQLKDWDFLANLFTWNKPIHIADVWSDDPQAQILRSLFEEDAAGLLTGTQSWMWVPLTVKKRMIGALAFAHKKQNFFTPHHAVLALSVADKAAITMVNAELAQQAQTVAVMEERQRLARNLHDAVNQSLFSAGLIAEVLPRLWERDPEEARHSLQDLLRLTRGAQAEMRALLAELRPSTLTDSNLGDLLSLLGNAFSGRTNIPVAITLMGNPILPANVQVAFYRVCQEALSNVDKHAKASQVEINLKQDEGVIEMRIRDDGLGFDVEQKLSGHYGLSMMRERANAVEAQLDITSQPGHGSEVTICWVPPKPE